MADASKPIFNKRAAEKLRSPDDLDKFVQVTNPSVWVVLGACILLLFGLLAWGVFGTVETSVTTTGAILSSDGDEAAIPTCFLSATEVTDVNEGDSAVFLDQSMKVKSVSTAPISANEAKAYMHSDFLFSTLVKDDWVYVVTFEGDDTGIARDVPASVKITVKRVAPITLIFGGSE